MAYNTCCCCIPVRAGVLVIAGVSSAIYLASFVSLMIHRNTYLTLGDQGGAAFWVTAAVLIIYSLSSIFGVVGAIVKNRNMINFFRVLYWVMAIITLIVTFAVYIYALVRRNDIVNKCIDILEHPGNYGFPAGEVSTPDEATNGCNTVLRTYFIIAGVVIVIGNIIQMYFASVISAYAQRLKRINLHQRLHNVEDFPVEPVGKAHF
ncbi:hypothetical protein DM01DRAFT_1384721 [Hesseltinella vesiculosa]|uniref:Tetraspannin-domain-containing protein n=1 Tax=Hesseltinella vesiculosa TaxID=101127 RepID=A0A1X2GC47_9FUNG|nr:hypothetical protein DM01DRAFT_1384721 [Hesseltinella vesiculosa]